MSETGDMLEVEAWCTGGCNTFTTVPAETPEDERPWTCSRCAAITCQMRPDHFVPCSRCAGYPCCQGGSA